MIWLNHCLWRIFHRESLVAIFVSLMLGLMVVLSLCVSLGCASSLDDAKTAWNVGNAVAVQALDVVETAHQKDADACHDQECLNSVETKYHPIYEAFRVFRAALVDAKTLLEAGTVVDVVAAQVAFLTALAQIGLVLP